MASISVPSSIRGAKSLSPESLRVAPPAYKGPSQKVNTRLHAASISETNKVVKQPAASKKPSTFSNNTVVKPEKGPSGTKTVPDPRLASPRLGYNGIIKKEKETKIGPNQGGPLSSIVPEINKFPHSGLTSPKLKGKESITSRAREKNLNVELETSNSGSKTQRKPEGIAKLGRASPLNIPVQILSPSGDSKVLQEKKRVSSPQPLSANRIGLNSARKESMSKPSLPIEDSREYNKVLTSHKKAASSLNHDITKPPLHSPKPMRQSVLSNHTDTYKSVQIDLILDDKDTTPQSAGPLNKYRKSQGNIRTEDIAKATIELKTSAFSGQRPPRNKSHTTIKNMVIPTICIDSLDSPIENQNSKRAYNTTRSAVPNFTPSNEKSLHRLDSSLLQADKLPQGNEGGLGIAKRRISLQPSQNSNFSFPIQYFKPIEDSTLDKFIQSINDSQRSKLDIDIDEHDSKASNSPAQNSKHSGAGSRKSYVVPSTYLNVDTPAATTTNKGKVCQITGFNMTSRDLKQKELDTDRSQQPDSNQKGYSSLMPAELKSPSRSPAQKRLVQDGSKSYRGKERDSPLTIQPKTWKDMRETTASLKSINISSSSRRESAFAGSITSRQVKKRNEWEADDKFSNLDKLLAQLRDEAQNKTGNSLETDLSLEKGLFKEENELTNPDMDVLINKSFAKALIKIGHNPS